MSKPYDQIVVLDFETLWDRKTGYSLSMMTTEEYIRHERFHAFGACVRVYGSDEPIEWFRGTELRKHLMQYDWDRTAVLAHNAQFDVAILEWEYDVHPCFIFDTLSMARALRGVEVGNSLAKLAMEFGLPAKGNAVYSTEGLSQLHPALEAELAEYCKHDVYLCEQIFERLVQGYPSKELRLIDMTIKMYTRPVLTLDSGMLVNALHEEKEKREELLSRLGVDEAVLASNPKFAAVLETLGIPAPRKTSKTTGKSTLALAKNDAMFQALLNGENEDVALLCEARIAVKSTTERTRAQRFLDISRRGALPVPLSYYGAKTGRWQASKGSAINMQNLKRGSFLRKSIMAPHGHTIVVGDLSQIEPRVLAWLADYEELLDIFRDGGDPYATFGAQMFNLPGLNKHDNPELRQSAKSALLGAGYGLGWASFAAQLLVGFLGAPPVRYTKEFAKTLGVTSATAAKFLDWPENVKKIAEIPHVCTMTELVIHCLAAKAIIDKYRATAEPVVTLWGLFGNLIQYSLYEGNEYTHKCVTFKKGEILLPSGMSLLYPDLKPGKDDKGRLQWTYGKDETKLYSGKITNNCLAEGTMVLTDTGWTAIEKITTTQLVHDGVEFVKHAGKVFNGVQTCGTLLGVNITPEHEVLSDDGWQEASQVQKPYRPDLRHVNGASDRLVCRTRMAMAVPMQVRKEVCEDGVGRDQGVEAGRDAQLRMRHKSIDRYEKQHTRHEFPPGIHRVAQYGKQVYKAYRARVQKLRGAWDNGVRQVGAGLYTLLGRHGSYVPAGAGAGPSRQQRGVLAGELPLDYAPKQHDEPTQHTTPGGRNGTEPQHWDRQHNAVLPASARVAHRAAYENTRCEKPVYDIANAGPRTRFVVLGTEGPFIVHNCVQGVARCVMTDGMLRTAKKYFVAGTVHDEQIVVVPDAEVAEAKPWILAQMVVEPTYMPGIPLAAEGGAHKRYGLAKN